MPNNLQETSGILLIDKPRDYSSHDVINVCRKVLNTRRIGHSGTLDPMATGLLIVLVGRQATRRQDYFQGSPKTYSATLKLGIQTDTWDAHGQITDEQAVPPFTLEQVTAITQQLTGRVMQPIPSYSAKKVQGARMYELARRGHELEQRYAPVHIYAWENIKLLSSDEIAFTVTCACGTYVRALGQLLAQKLGTVGHLTALRREKTGGMDVTNALPAEQLKTMTPQDVQKHMLPADWNLTQEEETARRQKALADRQQTQERLAAENQHRKEREAARAARKAAARKLYEERHAENIRKFQAEKEAFLAKKAARAAQAEDKQ